MNGILFSISILFLTTALAMARLEVVDGYVVDQAPLTLPLEDHKLYSVEAGPWGALTYHVAYLYVPDFYVNQGLLPTDRSIWYFPEHSALQVRELMEEAGFHFSEREWNSSFRWVSLTDDGTRVEPTESFILSMTAEERSTLEVLLREHCDRLQVPTVIASGNVKVWFAEAKLDAEILQLIEKLCYRQNGVLLFREASYVMSKIESPQQRRLFYKALHKTRTLMLSLTVDEQSDLKAISRYWSRGYKQKSVLPLMQSVRNTPHVERLDVVHLLPPKPRELLYTYPKLSDHLLGAAHNCHWTAFNFFKAIPPNKFGAYESYLQGPNRWVEPVQDALAFGDIISLFVEHDTPIHSAVYIADDLVYTKNGVSGMQPWVLMRYSDMLALYSIHGAPEAKAFRLIGRR